MVFIIFILSLISPITFLHGMESSDDNDSILPLGKADLPDIKTGSSLNLLVDACKNLLQDSNKEFIDPQDLNDHLIQDTKILAQFLKQNQLSPTPTKKDIPIFQRLKEQKPDKYKAFCAAIVNSALQQEKVDAEIKRGKRTMPTVSSGSLDSMLPAADVLTWWSKQVEKNRTQTEQDVQTNQTKFHVAFILAVVSAIPLILNSIFSYIDKPCS